MILYTKDIIRIFKKPVILRVFLICGLLINNIHSINAQEVDSVRTESTPKSSVEHPVDYNSEDSTVIDFKEEVIYLYGNAHVHYDDIDIDADYIEFRFGEDLVVAKMF